LNLQLQLACLAKQPRENESRFGNKKGHVTKSHLSGVSSGKERGYFFSRGREAVGFHANRVITPELPRAGDCKEAVSVFPQPDTPVD